MALRPAAYEVLAKSSDVGRDHLVAPRGNKLGLENVRNGDGFREEQIGYQSGSRGRLPRMTSSPQSGQPEPVQPEPSHSPSRTPWLVAGLLVLAIVVGVACFFIGKSSAETSSKESEAATRVRAARVVAQYQPGQPAYQAIFDKGKAKGLKEGRAQGQATGEAQGKKVGLEQGTAQGKAEGDATGVKNGATAALGGFTSWDTNSLYVVTVDPGQGNVPYTITSRQQMDENVNYRPCANNPQDLCQIPVASAG